MLALWKESHDKPRQHVKKQRHHFANKCPYSQSYVFSSSHVWMWELDHKEGCSKVRWKSLSHDQLFATQWTIQSTEFSRPKYWSISLSISPSNKYLRLISFKIDYWFDLFAVQGALKSLLKHHNLKASIFQCSAFYIVQALHLYMTTRKTIALTIWTFVGKVMSLLFNMLSGFVIAFLPRSKHPLILWL